MEKELRGKSFDFFNNTSEPILANDADVRFRASLVQDVIDRLIDRKFGKEYLEDLKRLNSIYRIEYKWVNGVRLCESSIINPEPKLSSRFGEITVGANSTLSYENVSMPALLEESDVQLRANLVQQVIDRVLDKVFGKEYLTAIQELHNSYPLGYAIVDGVRTYETELHKESKTPAQEIEKLKKVALTEVNQESVVLSDKKEEDSLAELSNIVKETENNTNEEVSSLIGHVKNVLKKKDSQHAVSSYPLTFEGIGGPIKEYFGFKKNKTTTLYKPEVFKKMFVFQQTKERPEVTRCEAALKAPENILATKKTSFPTAEALEYNNFIHFIKNHHQSKSELGKKKSLKSFVGR